MNRKKAQFDQEAWKSMRISAGIGLGLKPALVELASNPWGFGELKIWKTLENHHGKRLNQIESFYEFWTSGISHALAALTDRAYEKKIGAILKMMLEGQFSESPYRRSYRSANFGYYGQKIVTELGRLIRAFYYKENVAELLSCAHEDVLCYEYLLAYELRNGNAEISELVREAMYGENGQIILTRQMIEAIVISGNEALLDDLLKLLVVARQQEGLRQQILECADKGSVQTFVKILKCCIDEDMFRYSSAIRALDTWTGFGYTDEKAKVVKLCAELAYRSLTDEEARRRFFDSKNTLEVYFSLWSQGCFEIDETHDLITRLLEDDAEDRNILGWMFVDRTDASQFQMLLVKKNLAERNEKLLACMIGMFPFTWQLCSAYYADKIQGKRVAVQNPKLPEMEEDRKQMFLELKELVLYIGNRKREFSFHQLGGGKAILENTPVFRCMLSLAGYEMDDELIDELIGLSDLMNADMKQALIKLFLNPEKNEGHRAFLHKMIGDRSAQVKEIAVKRLSLCRLRPDDLDRLSQGLQSKSSSLRNAIMSVLQEQPKEGLFSMIGNMLATTDEYQNQAAVELLMMLKEDIPDAPDRYEGQLKQLRNRKLTTQTEILLDQLLPKNAEEIVYGPENGYGLYEPEEIKQYLAELDKMTRADAQGGFFGRIFGKGGAEELFGVKEFRERCPSFAEFEQLCTRLNMVFQNHANDEVEGINWYNGATQTMLFGDEMYCVPLPKSTGCSTLNDPEATFEMMPYSEEFLAAFEGYGKDIEKMAGLFHYATDYYSESGLPNSLWFAPIAATGLNSSPENRLRPNCKRYSLFVSMINVLPTLFDQHEVFAHAMKCYRSAVKLVGEDNLAKSYKMFDQDKAKVDGWIWRFYEPQLAINCRMLGVWRKLIRRLEMNAEEFAQWFRYEYRLEKLVSKEVEYGLSVHDYFRAYSGQIIPKGAVMEYLLDKESNVSGKMMKITNPARAKKGEYRLDSSPEAMELIREFTDRIVSVEEKRGEMPTPLSEHCKAVERVEGAHHFCALLAALGKETFYRGYSYSTDMTKKGVLSHLLKRCYPSGEDSAERLKKLIRRTDITENRLVEAVMYAPQWAGFAEEILGWKGLKCGVWFFHAHINEDFTAEKETEVAIYSPISPGQFNDGAFDKNWFWEAYDQLGEKRFQLLYRAAKYITSGGNQHRRSQLYADAVLGKLDRDELETEIREKRNQEKLRCYPLLPIAKGNHTEALHRYEFICQFQKESRQFGAQRRESEKKACATALENLAITIGLTDVNRLMWKMEGEKLESIRPMLEPIVLDQYSVRLNIDEDGDAGIVIEKGGKIVKTVPKSLAKNEVLLERKAVVKELKEQKRRFKETMEWAMINSSRFEPKELMGIMRNPILAPMVGKLVWITDNEFGFLKIEHDNLRLETLSGRDIAVKNEARLVHPHDLRSAGVWTDWMHLLYMKKIVQPFKQVFREYYPLTEDERQERTISRRYAGHQVQPHRTVALLKSRGWTVDYEEGLQKVFYNENLIVRMFAMADWFSPADIEAPTLETVEFFDRKTGENVPLEDVPPILFSETMRDLDLVVSVAHVGGVDPEASHSTVEMRVAIAAELVTLLGLTNVSWIGYHAKIKGSLASYSVHMGSGVVHAEGTGMIAILPVHSQKRGRIFLPFADDDPKTAEIMSKILLLAEDKKIKDPSILMQIAR